MRLFLILTVVIVVALAGGIMVLGPVLSKGGMGFSAKATGTPVRMEPVRNGKLVQTVSAPGRIEPHTKIEISSRVNAEIIRLPFREGETVQEGDIVVHLDDRDLKARLAGQQASLESAKASVASAEAGRARTEAQLHEQIERRNGNATTLEFAQRTLQRKQELYDSGDIALTELEAASERVRDVESQIAVADTMISAAESSLASSDAQVLQAMAAVKQADAEILFAEEGLRNTIIRSPITGKVTRLNAEVGESVVAGAMNQPGFVFMTIADLSRMKMIADILDDKSFEDWSLGVNVEIPIGNEAAEARINRAILAARQSVILAAAVLQSEQRIFDTRDRTSTDVLNAAAQLADAQLAEIRALADYQISQVDLAFATGSVLGSAQVRWDAETLEAAE